MKEGRRGRSKTQKLCLSSDPSSTNTSISGRDQGHSGQWMDRQDRHDRPHERVDRHDRHIVHQNPSSNVFLASPKQIRTPGGTIRPKNLGRIKSLSKIEIRSPVLRTTTPGATPLFSPKPLSIMGADQESRPLLHEMASVDTVRTNLTLSSRLMNTVVSKSFYKLRNYYNDFTTIDWVQAFVAQNRFNYELEHRSWIVENNEGELARGIPFYYKTYLVLGKWVLIVLIGFFFSLIAYSIDKIELVLVGFKHGYCRNNWLASQVSCCIQGSPTNDKQTIYMNVFKSGTVARSISSELCPDWISWSTVFENEELHNTLRFDFAIYVLLTILLAYLACLITLSTKTTTHMSLVTNKGSNTFKSSSSSFGSSGGASFNGTDLDFGDAPVGYEHEDTNILDSMEDDEVVSTELQMQLDTSLPHESEIQDIGSRVIYTASGSGVPEVKTILSGFVIRRFLGTYTLFAKTSTLVLAIASGMSLGKEGPYVHLATCVGNILSRLFPYIHNNDMMKKQILSASASSGVALAFGSPLGGVLFILEEINHYLPSNQLFQIFFCAIISTLFLKFLNPYGTGKTVLFELLYFSDWSPIELVFFVMIGIMGGVFGAAFVKFVRWWPTKFRQMSLIKDRPVFEVFCISLLTGVVTFWNPYTKQASSELVLDLATPCQPGTVFNESLCPLTHSQFVAELGSLGFAFLTKIVLTFVTFGLKLPCGIYVPSMVVGALFGRIFGMLIQWANYHYNIGLDVQHAEAVSTSTSLMRFICPVGTPNNECIDLGIYSMISAGAFMAGVTRMNITLVTILFELTSSYTYVLPISIAIAVANWMGGVLEKNSLYESLLILNDYPFMSSETEPLDPFVSVGDIINESDTFNSEECSKYHSLSNKRAPCIPKQPLPSPKLGTTGMLNVNEYIPMGDINDNRKLYIDISSSPYVAISVLQAKLLLLAEKSLLDGCIPLIVNEVCTGLIFFSELEYCLDKLESLCTQYSISDEIYCKLLPDEKFDTSETTQMIIRKNQIAITSALHNYSSNFGATDYFSYGLQNHEDSESTKIQQLFYDLTDLTDSTDYFPLFINYDSELTLAHLIFDKIGTRVIVLLKEGKYYGVLHKKILIDYCRQEALTK